MATPDYDLIIIGTGSGNSLPGPDFSHARIALIEDGPFGGTCLNRGCIPTKMFVHTAHVARTISTADPYGVHAELTAVDWPAIRDRIFSRIDPIAAAGEEYREEHSDNANLTVYRGRARFVGTHRVEITMHDDAASPSPVSISGKRIVIAAGARPHLPSIDGLAEAGAHTSDTIMRLEALPESLAIIGGGFIAMEFAHIFSALGTRVSLINRSERLLRREDEQVSELFTELARDYLDVHLGLTPTRVTREDGQVIITGNTADGESREIRASELLVATGRTPNADQLNLAEAGYLVTEDGRVATDAYQRALLADGTRPAEGVFALGDICSPWQLKHLANHEARIVRHNLLNPDELKANRYLTERVPAVPHAVFAHPQVAAVGLTESEARAGGYDAVVGIQKYRDIAYGWAMRDVAGFAKIIAERSSGRILGAHIIGPDAASLIQILIQAMSCGQSVRDIARTQLWIHPAMPELVENALLQVIEQL